MLDKGLSGLVILLWPWEGKAIQKGTFDEIARHGSYIPFSHLNSI
jgi:hypothetical protein